MALCLSHQKGETPRFLKYYTCNPCAETYEYRKKNAAQRIARTTRANRKTARINGRPATSIIYLLYTCRLPKLDYWRQPHVWFRTRCKRCGGRKKRKVAA